MTTKRKPGAQKRNKNALKHGFYSELLTVKEQARFNKLKDIDLDDEIKLLRAIVYKLRENISLNDLSEDELKALNTLANIIQVINTTTRTKLLARGGGGEIAQTIMEAIMSLDPYKEL
jgi:uncharacterized protein YjcR